VGSSVKTSSRTLLSTTNPAAVTRGSRPGSRPRTPGTNVRGPTGGRDWYVPRTQTPSAAQRTRLEGLPALCSSPDAVRGSRPDLVSRSRPDRRRVSVQRHRRIRTDPSSRHYPVGDSRPGAALPYRFT
jgi:hypothetical protein